MPARGAQIRFDRIREVYGRPGTPIYATPVLLTYLVVQTVALLWRLVDVQRALIWAGVMLLVQLCFGLLLWRFHHRVRTDDELPTWASVRTAFEAIHGLAWASSAALLLRPGEPVALLGVMVTLVGLVTANAASLAVHVPSVIAFVTAAMAPAIVILSLGHGGPPEVYAAIMLFTTLLAVVANALRMSAVYDEGIRLRLDLKQQVEQRRALQEIAEAARLEAENAAAERNRFFGAASHDLRQPVHALGLYASLLRRDPPARERRELIANVAACVDSLERLFNAILGVARAADSDRRKDVVAMELQDLIDRVVLQLKPEAEARGLRLRVRRTSARVEADPGDLERILTNLVANGIRYTERGGVLVGARRRGRGVDLIVVDTGVGLREEDQQRIFEPFYQVGVPQRDRDQGFGLGLATVRQLCLRHGYEIDVCSQFGWGARFRVSLPPATQETRLAPAAAAADEVPDKLNVLLVEDDPLVADAVRRILEAWDVTVHVSATAEGGLAVLRRAGPGRWHALLDYRLPGGFTGLELAEEIRTHHGAGVRITLITGEADPAVFEAAKRSGFLVLQKPLRPIRLRALLGSELALTAPAS